MRFSTFSLTNFLAKIFLGLLLVANFNRVCALHDTLKTQKQFAIPSIYNDSVAKIAQSYVPALHEDIIQDRLLCIQNEIKMTYHSSVGQWISFYAIKNRDYTRKVLNRSTFYFPIFEEALKRHNMPDELKYLSIVESALQPKAMSFAAAAGLWQFIPSTGKEMGLEQDWYIDERLDLYKSTDAACRYLKTLYNMFGDWQLALASYNCGPGWVQYAVKKAGGKADFWEIYKYLPGETRSYVPAFISVCYIMKHLKEHNIYADAPEAFLPSDVVLVSNFINLEELARQIDTPFATLQTLNPHLKKNIVPHGRKDYPVRIPADKKLYFETNRNSILLASSRASQKLLMYLAPTNNEASSTKGKNKIVHTVALGQSLPLIALQYDVQVANIKLWNRLYHDIIYPNQQLEIWTDKNIPQNDNIVVQKNNNQPEIVVANYQAITQPAKITPVVNVATKTQYHIVHRGDNLWDIAKKYSTTVEKIKKANRFGAKSMLMPGQKLLLY